MMIKIWVFLTIVAVAFQIIFVVKKLPRYIGLCLPFAFLVFAIYAWNVLAERGLDLLTLLAFMIPPVLLLSIFELFYWRQRCTPAGYSHWRMGLSLLLLYLLLQAGNIRRVLAVSKIRLRPNYYQAAALIFPGIWLLLICFTVYYYRMNKKNREGF